MVALSPSLPLYCCFSIGGLGCSRCRGRAQHLHWQNGCCGRNCSAASASCNRPCRSRRRCAQRGKAVLPRRRKRRRKTGIADLGIFIFYAEERAGLFEAVIKNNGDFKKYNGPLFFLGTLTCERECVLV